ncbi:MAG: KH domain-containing protein, partial [Acidobacteriota bacterium]
TIVVERSTQKAIVIGQKGQRLKKIGTMARRELEKIFPPKVYLELFVKVTPHWRDNAQMVKSLDVHDSTS